MPCGAINFGREGIIWEDSLDSFSDFRVEGNLKRKGERRKKKPPTKTSIIKIGDNYGTGTW
jgi:hypothetical protein